MTPLHFSPGRDGAYHAAETLPEAGQWDVVLSLHRAQQEMTVTRRVVVQ